MIKHGLLILSVFTLTFTQDLLANETKWRVGVGTSLSTATKAEGDLVVSGLSDGLQLAEGSLEYERKDSVALSIEARLPEENSWGFAGGILFEPKSKLKSAKLTLNGSTAQFNGYSEDKIQITTLYANALYRWNSFYIPFGLNYTNLKVSPKDPDITVDGGLGIQVGLGYWFNQNLTGELIVKSATMEMIQKDVDDDIVLKMKDATITNVHIGIKYFF